MNFYSGCTYDRYIRNSILATQECGGPRSGNARTGRNKHKITDRAFLMSRIVPYELQEWINEDSLELLPLGCSFGYNDKGKVFNVNIPRHLDVELIFCQFLVDIKERHEKPLEEKY